MQKGLKHSDNSSNILVFPFEGVLWFLLNNLTLYYEFSEFVVSFWNFYVQVRRLARSKNRQNRLFGTRIIDNGNGIIILQSGQQQA